MNNNENNNNNTESLRLEVHTVFPEKLSSLFNSASLYGGLLQAVFAMEQTTPKVDD